MTLHDSRCEDGCHAPPRRCVVSDNHRGVPVKGGDNSLPGRYTCNTIVAVPKGRTRKADPLLKSIAKHAPELLREDPPPKRLTKGEAATGAPAAGRSSLSQVMHRGPFGFLQLLGPGLVTGASDDDPSGIGTYSQVGSQFGYGFLWTALFTFPLMAAVQELCGRIALHTGVGLGTSLRNKFPSWLVGGAILALLVANTVNIGADLGAVAAGAALLTGGHVSAAVFLVPIACLIFGLQLFTAYSLIFRLFKYLTLALFAYVITAVLSHPNAGTLLTSTFVPHFEWNGGFITALVAILGTTISPYLFFWQASSEVDEMKAAGLRTRKQRRNVSRAELRAARTDILIGMGFSQLIMYCIIASTATVLHAHGQTGVSTAADAAKALQPIAGQFAFVVFSVGLIGTGLLAIPILSGSAAYAVKEFFGMHGSLAAKPRYRPTFYAIIGLAMLVGLLINLIGFNVIKALFITAVINGAIAPPLLVLIVLLGSDKKVMADKRSGRLSRTLTWVATGAMGLATVGLVFSPLLGS
jgi:NRAMP (natural resistance-associated macrophage protein)-like metal ion transporter